MNRTREMEILRLQQVCKKCKVDWITIYLNPRKIVDRVEGCVIVAALFMIILAIGAPRRRQSRSIIIRYGVEGVFILSFPLLSYTLGMMQGQIIKNELYPVWAMFLAMLFGGTNSMSVQKLEENCKSMKLYCDYLFFTFYVGTILNGLLITVRKEAPYTFYIAIAIGGLLGAKNTEQWGTAKLASKPSNGIKWLALYRKREHQLSTSYDPRTMQGYKYPVFIHLSRPITLDKIWCGNIGVLSSCSTTPIRRLKDLCLSFSLSHLVVRRYFGYTCPESKLDKTRDLVLDGLLRTEQDYERAFQVIVAEYGDIFLSIGAGTWSLSVVKTHRSILDDHLVETNKKDIMVTKIALGALSIFQLLQIWSYRASDWAKVSLVCKYVTHPSWQGNACIEKLLLLGGRPHRCLRYWRNTIDQYSVFDSFNCSFLDWFKHLFQNRKAGKPLELPMEVKRAVARAIKNTINGHLSNGTSTLARHGMSGELCWAREISNEFTLIHIILVWHVATSYCEISEAVRLPDEIYVHRNQVVATSLSKYCAYLVGFAPKLLPGSPAETESTLDEVVEEAKVVLQDLALQGRSMKNLRIGQCGKRDNVHASVDQGCYAGEELQRMENRTIRWDLLADLWAEMMVYISPSDNIAGHIERLAEGGEFLTHVWALLMHAGILERPAVIGDIFGNSRCSVHSAFSMHE